MIQQELEAFIEEFTRDWGTDEMIELLGECEFALSGNEGRIEQLKAKGLKRLYNAIMGYNKKNRQIVMDNVQAIQRFTFDIQKIILKRIDILSFGILNLNEKLDTEIFWTRKVISGLLEKINNVSTETKLTKWQVNVQNKRMENGSRYMETQNSVKILLTVSDVFEIIHDQFDLIDETCLETILYDSLKLPKRIKLSEFYEDIINNKDCLPLYVKKDYDYPASNISEYGRMIYKINGCYTDYDLMQEAANSSKSLRDMCIEAYGKQIQKEDKIVSPVDLCSRLLEDLADLYSEYKAKIEAQKRQEEEEELKNTGVEEKEKMSSNIATYAIVKMTVGDYKLFQYNESNKDNLIVVPTICKLEDHMNYNCITLSDYYMYLWFCHTDENKRRNKNVAFIEIDKRLYVTGYTVNDLGDGYERKGIKDIHFNRTGNNIISDIKKILHIPKNGEISVYETSYDDKIYKRLEDKENGNVGLVNQAWEDFLPTDNEELGEIIKDIINKSA